ncbi:MAG: hypothetical protein JNL82_10735 [Myxococcales bacterium]|nr:hypothetical protein [Myxococcales bacterium]
MKKLLFIVAFVSSATVGAAACNSDLKDACEQYVEVRDACEALSPPEPDDEQKYFTDICANIDPDCKEYFECAVLAYNESDPDNDFCEEDSKGRFRLNVKKMNDANLKALGADNYVECKEPENKACTDADLRP